MMTDEKPESRPSPPPLQKGEGELGVPACDLPHVQLGEEDEGSRLVLEGRNGGLSQMTGTWEGKGRPFLCCGQKWGEGPFTRYEARHEGSPSLFRPTLQLKNGCYSRSPQFPLCNIPSIGRGTWPRLYKRTLLFALVSFKPSSVGREREESGGEGRAAARFPPS